MTQCDSYVELLVVTSVRSPYDVTSESASWRGRWLLPPTARESLFFLNPSGGICVYIGRNIRQQRLYISALFSDKNNVFQLIRIFLYFQKIYSIIYYYCVLSKQRHFVSYWKVTNNVWNELKFYYYYYYFFLIERKQHKKSFWIQWWKLNKNQE